MQFIEETQIRQGAKHKQPKTWSQRMKNHLKVYFNQLGNCKSLNHGAVHARQNSKKINKKDWIALCEDKSIREELLTDLEHLAYRLLKARRVKHKEEYLKYMPKFIVFLGQTVHNDGQGLDQYEKQNFFEALFKLQRNILRLLNEANPPSKLIQVNPTLIIPRTNESPSSYMEQSQ